MCTGTEQYIEAICEAAKLNCQKFAVLNKLLNKETKHPKKQSVIPKVNHGITDK